MQIYFIALSVGILVYAVVRLVLPISEKEAVEERVSKYFKANTFDDAAEQIMKERSANFIEKNLKNERLVSRKLADYVLSTGVKLTPTEFLYAWIGATLLPVMVFVLLGLNLLTVFAAGIIGLLVPPVLLARAREKRQELFTAQLGEAVIVMGNAIKGGFSFTQAMESVAAEMQPPIASEFGKSIREMQYGMNQEETLRKMADRIKNEDLNLLVSAVLTSAQVGGNLSDILDTISATIKDRIRIKQEVRVLTSSGRLSAVIIGLMPVFLVLVLMFLNPTYFGSFVETRIGQIMLMVSIILEIIGFLFIKKLSDIQY